MEERVQGRKTAELADLPKRPRAVVARRIARFVLEPAFERGVFYADPHPGNLLVQEDGSLSVIDFGKVGRLTPETRRRVADMFIAIARSDAQRVTDRLIEVTAPTRPIDRDAMTREIDRMLALYVNVSLEHVRFGDAIGELLQLVRRHGLRVPGTLVQFFKALAMCEGILQAIDPESSFTDYLQPMSRKLVYEAGAVPARSCSLACAIQRSTPPSSVSNCPDESTGSWGRPGPGGDRTRQSAGLDARRRCRAIDEARGASGGTIERHDPRGGVHRGAGNRHALLPTGRMGQVDRCRVLDCGWGCTHRLRENVVDVAQVRSERCGVEFERLAEYTVQLPR